MRDGGRCLIALPGCMGYGTCPDHRANRGAGGSKLLDDPANLILACGLCNGAKADAHDSRADLIDRGVVVPRRATNAQTLQLAKDTPVLYPDGHTYYLLSFTELRRAA